MKDFENQKSSSKAKSDDKDKGKGSLFIGSRRALFAFGLPVAWKIRRQPAAAADPAAAARAGVHRLSFYRR